MHFALVLCIQEREREREREDFIVSREGGEEAEQDLRSRDQVRLRG